MIDMRVLITRAQPDADTFAAKLDAADIGSVIAPIFSVRPTTDIPPEMEDVSGLLMTSANGVRAFAALCPERDLPVYAVGDATARAARAAGFDDVVSADGDVVDLAALVRRLADPTKGALLHPAGRERAGDLRVLLGQFGFTVRREVIYRAAVAEVLPTEAMYALREGVLDGAAFFSPRTADAFVTLVKDAGLASNCADLVAFCLSQAVSNALAEAPEAPVWRERAVAMRPTGDDLYHLIHSHAGAAPDTI